MNDEDRTVGERVASWISWASEDDEAAWLDSVILAPELAVHAAEIIGTLRVAHGDVSLIERHLFEPWSAAVILDGPDGDWPLETPVVIIRWPAGDLRAEPAITRLGHVAWSQKCRAAGWGDRSWTVYGSAAAADDGTLCRPCPPALRHPGGHAAIPGSRS